VLAVFITIRFKLGFFAGAILLMFTLAIYQAKFNIALALCVFYLLIRSISRDFDFKIVRNLILRLSLMAGLEGILYAISLPVSFYIHNADCRF